MTAGLIFPTRASVFFHYSCTGQPVVEKGRALLRGDVATNWATLDEAGTARLIGQVNAWYDALNGGSTPKTRGRHSKTKSCLGRKNREIEG